MYLFAFLSICFAIYRDDRCLSDLKSRLHSDARLRVTAKVVVMRIFVSFGECRRHALIPLDVDRDRLYLRVPDIRMRRWDV